MVHSGETGIRRQVLNESEGRAEGNPAINHSLYAAVLVEQPFDRLRAIVY